MYSVWISGWAGFDVSARTGRFSMELEKPHCECGEPCNLTLELHVLEVPPTIPLQPHLLT